MFFQSCHNGGKSNKQKADSINAENKPMAKEAAQFMVEAAVINLTEIKLGTIAQKQASSNRVQNYAAMIVSDHKKLQKKLQKLSKEKQIAIPDSLDKSHQNDISGLRKQKGKEVDRIFINDMVKGHKKAIKTFKKASEDIQHNQALDNYIEKTLPGLNKHLDSAQKIRKALDLKKTKKGVPPMPIPKS